jgi:hypothetical protein
MMSDFHVLNAVRGHLLNEDPSLRVHLALPPKAIYPLILGELEEIWSPYLFRGSEKRKGIRACVKFKLSAYSQTPGMEEAALLSNKIRQLLEGAILKLPGERIRAKSANIRLLACVIEKPGNAGSSQRLNGIHHFFDSIVRG